MAKATIDIPEKQDRILNIVKGLHGFKNKSEAISYIIEDYEKNLDLEINPEYLKKLKETDKQKGTSFKNTKELRQIIEKD